MVHEFIINQNEYLQEDIRSYYSEDYINFHEQVKPRCYNLFKNTYKNYSKKVLEDAKKELREILQEDLPLIIDKIENNSLTICVVPRAKAEESYEHNQLLFKKVIQEICDELSVNDGTDYIVRHTNTLTTHLQNARNMSNYNNDGDAPYPGITNKTCHISNSVNNKEILLIDDIYTEGVNIDEDAIQALLDKGAKAVNFYAVAFRPRNKVITGHYNADAITF